MLWSLLTALNYCVTLGLENPMENVQVHDLTTARLLVNCTFLTARFSVTRAI